MDAQNSRPESPPHVSPSLSQHASAGQSFGLDPKNSSTKRNSALFTFFKWFKVSSSSSRDSINTANSSSSSSSTSSKTGSCESVNSIQSNATVASFSFVPPNAYKNTSTSKCIVPGPETDTYRARLKQRDKRRENDKNTTLRKKYNLFFNRDSLIRLSDKGPKIEESTKSLPSRTNMPKEDEEIPPVHRRTNSESSRGRKAGAYLHVKGKRKAPQPPGYKNKDSTMSLRRKKRLAPTPPMNNEHDNNKLSAVASTAVDVEVICNDSLKLDHGILKPAKEVSVTKETIKSDQNNLNPTNLPNTSARSSINVDPPVSPRPWYKRHQNRENNNHIISNTKKEIKSENKYEPIERLPEVQFMRNSTLDLTLEDTSYDKHEKNKPIETNKRKSGISFLTNISELDREASEIIKNEHRRLELKEEMPEFMRPKQIADTDSWISPKRRSARDLIAKFNAITNVTKATVFGVKDNSKYFGKQRSLDESSSKRQELLLESHQKCIEQIDVKKQLKTEDKMNALMKSESASAIKANLKVETPKAERKNWMCSKCSIPNEHWRIICHVCSAIKPYFDDFAPYSAKDSNSKINDVLKSPQKDLRKMQLNNLERSKTQIGFSVLASYNSNNAAGKNLNGIADEKSELNKKEEKEKLKKMLIEMKNSLPKKKINAIRAKNCASIIDENSENVEIEAINNTGQKAAEEFPQESKKVEQKQENEKKAEILIGFTETIYENIKVRDSENPKPLKLSSATQTSAIQKQIVPPLNIQNIVKNQIKSNNNYELMRPKDFENIYTDKNSAARLYANLAQNDELSLFFNMPKNLSNTNININNNNTDTIEINRLLRRLETAIAKGELAEAAIFAKELAQLKVNCSVIRQKGDGEASGTEDKNKIGFQIEMFVEDKISHRGPFPLQVTEHQTVAELKKQVEKEFEIPIKVQRWILGKELATNDKATLKDHHVTNEGCPVFLYLVLPEQTSANRNSIIMKETKSDDQTNRLVKENKNNECRTPKIVDVIPKTPETKRLNKDMDQKNSIMSGSAKPSTVSNTKETEIKQKDINQDQKINIKKLDEIPAKQIELQKIKINDSSVIHEQTKPITVNQNKELKFNAEKTVTKREETKLGGEVVTNSVVVLVAPELRTVENISLLQNKLTENRKASEAREKLENQMLEYRNNKTKDFNKNQILPSTSTSEGKNHVKVAEKTFKMDQASNNLLQETSRFDKVIESNAFAPPKAKIDGLEEFDKTLKAKTLEWECHLCTLLNPITSNVCSICATVRLNKAVKKSVKKKAPKIPADQTYLQLVNLDNADLVENNEPFECVICFMEVAPKNGITLRECLHQFCKICLAHTIEYSEEAEIKCPYRDNDYSCNIPLQDREIKALVSPQVYDQYLAKSVMQAENKSDKSFHCKTPDCKGWCIFEDNVNEFKCPVCRKPNCLTCQAIHDGLNCKQYQEKMNQECDIDENAKRTKEMLEEMVNKGEALNCPTCKVILMKKWGCDWLRCSMCKTEICWVTRGPRWGPAGKGDTSGGCKCGVNNIKCHPKCNYCH